MNLPVIRPVPALAKWRAASNDGALRGIALMILAVFLFTILDACAKLMVGLYPVQQVAWARYFFHCLLMLLLLPRIGIRGLIRTTSPMIQIVRGLLVAMATVCMMAALTRAPLADVYTITFAAPLLITLFSVPLLKEKVGWRRIMAVLVGFMGVLIVIRPGAEPADWIMILPLATATCFALYQVLTRKVAGRPGESPLAMLFYMALVGTLTMSCIVPGWWQPVAWQHWLAFVAMGALGAIGHLLLIRALNLAQASLLSPLIYTQLIWAIAIGYVLFGDVPDGWTLLGGAVIIASGLFIISREAGRRTR